MLNLTSIVGDAKEASARILGDQFNRCPFDRLDAECFELRDQVLKHSHHILDRVVSVYFYFHIRNAKYIA